MYYIIWVRNLAAEDSEDFESYTNVTNTMHSFEIEIGDNYTIRVSATNDEHLQSDWSKSMYAVDPPRKLYAVIPDTLFTVTF